MDGACRPWRQDKPTKVRWPISEGKRDQVLPARSPVPYDAHEQSYPEHADYAQDTTYAEGSKPWRLCQSQQSLPGPVRS